MPTNRRCAAVMSPGVRTSRPIYSPLILIVMFLLASGLLLAQSNTTGAIRGVVKDQTGTPIPGVTVTATSNVLVAGQVTTITGDNGVFVLPALPPGVYTVKATLEGFVPAKQENLRVQLGNVATLEMSLRVGTINLETEVIVTAESPQVSTVSNSTSHNLDLRVLDRMPLPRNANVFMDYTPGVNDSHAYGGTQENANAYHLDGVNVSDPSSGEHWILPNPDWIQEVQVAGLGASAEYGGFTGAVVNVVTKSGGNQFSGDVKFYYSGGSLVADNENDEGYKELSFSLGGPIIKDKMWFFFSGQESREDFTPFGAENSEDQRLSRYMGKITYQFNTRHRVIGLLDFDGKYVDRRGIAANRTAAASSRQESPNWSYNFTYEGTYSDRYLLTAKLTGFTGTDNRLPYHGQDTPGRRNEDRVWVDNNAYTNRQDKSRITADVAFSMFLDDLLFKNDSHQFKMGFLFGRGKDSEVQTRNGGYTILEYINSSDRGGEIFLHAIQKEYTLYAQDSWTIGRLTINPGIRYTGYRAGFQNGNDSVYNVDLFAPRIGFVFDILGDGSTVMKAHYGRYYEGMFTYLYDREQSGHVFTPTEYYDYNPDTGQYDIPAGGAPAASAVLNPDINHPYTDQYVLSLERQLPYDFMIGIDAIYNRFRNMVAMVNINDDYDHLLAPDNPLTGGNLPFYDLLSPQDYYLTNPQGAYRNYKSVVLRGQKRFSDNWSLRASLVWSQLKGNSYKNNGYLPEWEDLNGQTNADGKLPGNHEWEGKVSASYTFPFDIYSTVYYRYLSGSYWTPEVQIYGLYYNDRQYVYLERRGTMQLPDQHRVDLRLNKRFVFGTHYGIDLTLDIFNLFNRRTATDVDTLWGYYDYDYRNHPEGSYWTPQSGFEQVLNSMRQREIRLGVKFSF